MSGTCTNCGSTLKEGAKFCPTCGTPNTPAQAHAEPHVEHEPPGLDLKKIGLAAAGVGGIAILSLAAYAMTSGGPIPSLTKGAGQADRNGDGFITIDEVRTELLELQRPLQGRWKVNIEGNLPEDSDRNLFKTDFEINVCGERQTRDIDRFFNQLQSQDTFNDLQREYDQFRRETNGEIIVKRFTIDGDEIDFAIEIRGTASKRSTTITSDSAFELTGVMSGERIELTGPVKYAMNGSIYESEGGGTFEMDMSGQYKIVAERLTPCF